MKDVSKSGGYNSLVWIRDKDGQEYACPIDAFKGNVSTITELSETERAQCLNVNLLVGTERW